MKNNIITIILFLMLVSGTSCKKVLEIQPSDFLAPENYFTSEAQIDAYLASVYDVLNTNQESYREFYRTRLAEGTDESFSTSSTTAPYIAHYNAGADDVAVAGWWLSLYTGINRANTLLENMNKAPLTDAKRRHVLGELKFLRAYYHFNATQWWGDVPIKIKSTLIPEDGQIAFSKSKDVYDFVIKEMTEAEALLADQKASMISYNERVTLTTVQGMLARVCLFAAGYPVNDNTRYEQAINWAKKVTESAEHKLAPDYKQVFINHSADAYDNANRESMWEVGFMVVTSNPALREILANAIGVSTGSNHPAGFGRVVAQTRTTALLYRAYESVYNPTTLKDTTPDLRRDWCIAPYTYSGGSTTVEPTRVTQTWNSWWSRFPGKWRREYETVLPRDNNNSPQNFPLLRYADVLLMLAEAENEVNGPSAAAYDALNLVRRRAYGLNLPVPPAGMTTAKADAPAGMSKADFRNYIRDERMRELNGECLRKLDLRRWDILVTTVKNRADLATNGSLDRFPDNSQKIRPIAAADRPTAILDGTNISTRNNFLPIPALEISSNKLAKQNPGY